MRDDRRGGVGRGAVRAPAPSRTPRGCSTRCRRSTGRGARTRATSAGNRRHGAVADGMAAGLPFAPRCAPGDGALPPPLYPTLDAEQSRCHLVAYWKPSAPRDDHEPMAARARGPCSRCAASPSTSRSRRDCSAPAGAGSRRGRRVVRRDAPARRSASSANPAAESRRTGRMILRLIEPTAGTVEFDGRESRDARRDAMRKPAPQDSGRSSRIRFRRSIRA